MENFLHQQKLMNNVNGKTIETGTESRMINSLIYVPLRAISSCFGAEVGFYNIGKLIHRDATYPVNIIYVHDKNDKVIISEEELILQINDTQWVIASKYKEDTVDFIPQFEYFKNILSISSEWHELSIEILQNLIDGHPVSLVAKIANSDELSVIRLTRKLMKLRSDQCKTLDHKGQYTLISAAGDNFDETVCQIILHMEYKNIECINMYFVRKYTK